MLTDKALTGNSGRHGYSDLNFGVVGVEHQTCPVDIREGMAVEGHAHAGVLRDLMRHPAIDEALLVSTCARTEAYLWSKDRLSDALAGAGETLLRLNRRAEAHMQTRQGQAAIVHGFRVTSGRESQIRGESEVTAQVRNAIHLAREQGALGPHLDGFFAAATACARRYRREANIGQTEPNVAAAAAEIARDAHPIDDASVLIIGSGKIARMLAAEFAGARTLAVAARNLNGVDGIIAELGATRLALADAVAQLDEYDVVCCATRSRTPLIRVSDLRNARPMLIIDLGMPRNVAPEVGEHPGVTLLDIDAIAPASVMRADEALADSIITSEVHDFMSRILIRSVGPIISALREHVEHVRDQEVRRAQSRLMSLDDDERQAVEAVIQGMVDRMFHHLVVRLKLAALSDPDLIRAAEFFFAHGEDSLFPEAAGDPLGDQRMAIDQVISTRE